MGRALCDAGGEAAVAARRLAGCCGDAGLRRPALPSRCRRSCRKGRKRAEQPAESGTVAASLACWTGETALGGLKRGENGPRRASGGFRAWFILRAAARSRGRSRASRGMAGDGWV